jgi:hypothetical protein
VNRIRIEGLRGDELARLLLSVFRARADDLNQGAVISIQERRLGVKRLPSP